jgi:hypothetical protein
VPEVWHYFKQLEFYMNIVFAVLAVGIVIVWIMKLCSLVSECQHFKEYVGYLMDYNVML